MSGLGAAIGAVLGVGLVVLQAHYGVVELPADTFLTKSYPVELRAGDLLAVAVALACVVTVITRITVRSMIRDGGRTENKASNKNR